MAKISKARLKAALREKQRVMNDPRGSAMKDSMAKSKVRFHATRLLEAKATSHEVLAKSRKGAPILKRKMGNGGAQAKVVQKPLNFGERRQDEVSSRQEAKAGWKASSRPDKVLKPDLERRKTMIADRVAKSQHLRSPAMTNPIIPKGPGFALPVSASRVVKDPKMREIMAHNEIKAHNEHVVKAKELAKKGKVKAAVKERLKGAAAKQRAVAMGWDESKHQRDADGRFA